MIASAQLKQRADYTHKYNMRSGRHGWIRLTPAYSVKIVEEILSKYGSSQRVFDPFCGSGTTALCAAHLGISSTTTDINPFLVWLTEVKTKNYSSSDIINTRNALKIILMNIEKNQSLASVPPIHKIERWWSKQNLLSLRNLKGSIDILEVPKPAKNLLQIAFCRTLIKLSNAAFNHQSISFKNINTNINNSSNYAAIFRDDVETILNSCTETIYGDANVILKDARNLDSERIGKFDLVITSPPYANRMSYIRELRPYMYWLGYLQEAREAGELDWQAIGGTWGIATSRLNDWVSSNKYQNEHLLSVVEAISKMDNKHAVILSRYVRKYCDDIFMHLTSVSKLLKRGAYIHYIIGNSTFYGTLVKVEEIYADMMKKIGFKNINIRAIRKRNSKKELIEFDVSASW